MKYLELFTYSELHTKHSFMDNTLCQARLYLYKSVEAWCNKQTNDWLSTHLCPGARYDRVHHAIQSKSIKPCDLLTDLIEEPWASQYIFTAKDYRLDHLFAHYRIKPNWSPEQIRSIDDSLRAAYFKWCEQTREVYESYMADLSPDDYIRITKDILFTEDGKPVKHSLIKFIKEN